MRLDKFKNSIKSTQNVVLWVAISAAVTAVLSWMLSEPEYMAYYGIINVVLYFLKELNTEFRTEN